MAKTLILTHCYPPNGGSFIAHRAKTIGANVLTMGRPLSFLNFLKFVNDAVGSARKYDVIEAHWLYPAGIAAMIASWITGTPYRVFCHGTDVMMAERSWFWRRMAIRVMTKAVWTKCVSEFLYKKLHAICPWPAYSVEPMQVDKTIFYDRGYNRIGVKAIIKKNVGKYRPVVDNLTPIGNNNSQHQLAFIFCQTAVVVLASENEGYGLMLAEAAECGAKIIGVNEGGIPEVVAKYGGQLFDGTADDLIKKINIALNVEAGAVLQ